MRIPPLPLLLCTMVGGAACSSDIEPPLPLPPEESPTPTPPPTPTLPCSPIFDDIVIFPSPSSRSRRTPRNVTDTIDVTIPSPPTTTPVSLPFPTPTPLDLSISPKLTTNCISYLTNLLSTPLFLSCLPFSLLLTTSTSYATLLATAISTGDYTDLNILLSYVASPQPNTTQCQTYMDSLVGELGNKGQCGSDLAKTPIDPVAEETRVGLGNYKVMREAAGLVSQESGKYCYLEAVSNQTPDDLYLWSVPAGIPLPSTTTPTCSKCSEQLLNLYMLNLASNSTMNATIINNAVNTVNSKCGSAFVTYQAEAVSAAKRRVSVSVYMASTLAGSGCVLGLVVLVAVLSLAF
ncbi:hypothetical protein BCR39DRAFT_521504 [Naematelia encephala]|uniref:DUF7729 domain-containing protein n=1 Tax=Naematelia encephala TaxID=71784 RepID=A0A1Y2BD80_9TREE|nr:hypothetical protein BCR39DRAFT_521504 [Naematelia encephala]